MSLPPNPPGLPEASALDFQRLLAFPLESPSRMLIAIERHLHNVREASVDYPQVNLEMARQIAERLRELLNAPGLSELQQQWVQAAARYFFLNQDDGHDWESRDGFDDDLLVVECVARALAPE